MFIKRTVKIILCIVLILVSLLTPIRPVVAQPGTTIHRCAGRVWLHINAMGRIDSIPAVAATLQTEAGDATTTDSSGRFQLMTKQPPQELFIRSLGYQSVRISLDHGDCEGLSFTLQPATVELLGVLVETTNIVLNGAPAEVTSIDALRLEQVNATNLGEALPYTPGVQVENNCQTCGYTQVRLNGLAGPYTQILIDGQSLVGGLNAAYGLDHLPSALIERIEVLRGGGSAAYAANAVGGVVNVVTRKAQERGWGAVQQSSFLPNGGIGDHLWRVHADWVTSPKPAIGSPKPASGRDKFDKRPASATAFINHRLRAPYDRDGDGFSEIARLRGTSAGFLMEKRLSDSWGLRLNGLAIAEERRGGSDWQVEAPRARLSEEILQRSISTQLEAIHRNIGAKRETQFYLSQQYAQRKAYYGGSGDSLPLPQMGKKGLLGVMGEWSPWNAPHTSAYGRSTERITQAGFRWNAQLLTGWRLLAGSELNHKNLLDALPLVNRGISQQFLTWSRFAQVDGQILPSWRIHLGWRNDGVRLSGSFQQDTDLIPVSFTGNPGIWRGSLRWQPRDSRLSLSFVRSGGYRAPQVFTEDLHVELVGGAVRSIRWSPQLREERAVAYAFLSEFSPGIKGSNTRITAELFQTHLMRPLLMNDLDTGLNGQTVWQKSNGPDARILGAVVGTSGTSLGGEWSWDASFSLQTGRYDEAVRLSVGPDGGQSSRDLLRFPSWYGFLTLRRSLQRGWWLQYNYQQSGPMYATRMDATTMDALILVRTPTMGQHDLWVEKLWKLNSQLRLATELGCMNCANRFQTDLSTGPFRDASYVYGPSQPRRFSLRLRLLG